MRKNFDNIQTLKSREDCDKFSKSVSYETLVGGTSTTGRERKQTQKMFLGSANKPLSAVGTLTSLLCNSAKVVEKLLYRHSEPKVKNPKKTEIVIIGRGCEPIISAESKRDPRLIAKQSPRMTGKALSLSGASSEKQKESSLILRKAKFQAIFKFVLSSACGGAGGGKYNRISAFVSMPVLLIRRSREFFNSLASYARGSLIFATQKRNDGNMKNRDDRFCFGFAKVPVLALIFTLITTAESRAASDCAEGEQNCWDCGKTADDLCTARLNTSTKALSITGTGEMRDYPGTWTNPTTPWGVGYTSVSVQGVKNIGERAFSSATNLTSVNIGDTVKDIGFSAFDNDIRLSSMTIPDSVTSIHGAAYFNNIKLGNVFIPESVTSIDIDKADKDFGPFDTRVNGIIGGNKLYCAETTPCYSYIDSNIITYIKDSNGVYKIGDNYYASPDDMLANNVCGSGSSASDECITAALVYQDQKAENMAGGALCATKEGCMELINMANKKDVCSSIADCHSYAKSNNLSSILCKNREQVVWKTKCYDEYPFAKKRWTPAEANEWLHDGNDNFVVLTFKK